MVTIRNCLQMTIQRTGRLILKMTFTFEIQGRTWAQIEWTVTTSALFAPYSSSLRIMELISLQQRMETTNSVEQQDTTQLVHTCMHSEYWWPLMSSDQLLPKNIYSSLHFHRDTLMFHQIFHIMPWSRVCCWFTLFIQLYCKLQLEMRLVLLFNIFFFFTSIHCKSFGCLFSMSSWKV